MTTKPTFHIPHGELELPAAPSGHQWNVKNIIHNTEQGTEYSIKVTLLNQDKIVVMTVADTWDSKKELYADFAMGIVGLSTVELYSYLSFMSIHWDRDNSKWDKTENNSDGLRVIEYTGPEEP